MPKCTMRSLAILLLAAFSAAEGGYKGSVDGAQDVSDRTSFQETINGNLVSLALFYLPCSNDEFDNDFAEWCEKCQEAVVAIDVAARMLSHAGSEAVVLKVDASHHKELATEFAALECPEIRVFTNGELFMSYLPKPTNYDGEMDAATVMTNFLLSLMKEETNKIDDRREQWQADHADELRLRDEADTLQAEPVADKKDYERLIAIYAELLQTEIDRSEDEFSPPGTHEYSAYNLAVARTNRAVTLNDDPLRSARLLAQAKLVGCHVQRFCDDNLQHAIGGPETAPDTISDMNNKDHECTMDPEKRWSIVPHGSQMIFKYASASEDAADYKAYASKNCEDIIEEQEGSGQSVSEWDPYSASGSVATDAQ